MDGEESLYVLNSELDKHYIDIEEWDEKNLRVKKSNPNADSLNKLLSQQLSDANKALIDLQSVYKDASANQIKKEGPVHSQII